MSAKFVVKRLSNSNRFAFVDLYSDFKAVIDQEGLGFLRNIFSGSTKNWTLKEIEIANTIVASGLVDSHEVLSLMYLEERTNSLLGQLEIELTKRCNLPCIHCFTEKIKQDLPLDLLEENIESFLTLGVTDIVLNGGEIFLHKKIEDVLAMLNEKFKIILYTNGTVKNSVDIVRRFEVARVNVSLDGFLDAHEYIRGRGSYSKTIDIIHSFVSEGIPVQIDCVVYKKNNSYLDQFIEYCRTDLKACGVKLSTIYPLGNAIHHPELFEEAEINEQIYDSYLKEKNPGGLNSDYLPCLAGVTKAFINAYGQIYPCRLFEDPKFLMGDLRNNSMAQVYSSFMQEDSYFTKFKLKDHKDCSSCKSLKNCKTGCRARAYLSHSSLFAADKFACNHNLKTSIE